MRKEEKESIKNAIFLVVFMLCCLLGGKILEPFFKSILE